MADTTHDKAREIIERACAEAQFPAPPRDMGLGRWADESLNVALAPVGSEWWRVAHGYTIDALDSALRVARGETDATAAVVTSLKLARNIVEAYGRAVCACSPPGHVFEDVVGRKRCVKCLARSQ